MCDVATIKTILGFDFPVLTKAYALAQKVHKGQFRHGGKPKFIAEQFPQIPYIEHIQAVMINVYRRIGGHNPATQKGIVWVEACLVLAALHDAVEDHPDKVSFEDIERDIIS